MKRVVVVANRKGGVGKTDLVARPLMECSSNFGCVEKDASHRLHEYGDRVTYLSVLATPEEIAATAGEAARTEMDALIAAVVDHPCAAVVVDLGANVAVHALSAFSEVSDFFALAGVEISVVIPTTSEPGSVSEIPVMLSAGAWAARRFIVENEVRGRIPSYERGDAIVTQVPALPLSAHARHLLSNGGLACVDRLDLVALRATLGTGAALRVIADLKRFRSSAMQAAAPAAEWLAGVA